MKPSCASSSRLSRLSRATRLLLAFSLWLCCFLCPAQASSEAVASLAAHQTMSMMSQHVCAVVDDTVACWGQDEGGGLGFSTDEHPSDTYTQTQKHVNSHFWYTTSSTSESSIAMQRTHTDFTTITDTTTLYRTFQCSQNPRTSPLSFQAELGAAISVHGYTVDTLLGGTCTLFESAQVVCWGSSVFSVGVDSDDPSHPNVAGNAPAFVPVNFGTDTMDGELVPVTAVAVTRGALHACIIRMDGKMQCFGVNTYGQLGYGHTHTVGDSSRSVASAGPLTLWDESSPVVQIGAGNAFTCALLASGRAACWGRYYPQSNNLGRDFGSSELSIGGSSSHAVADLQPIVFGTVEVLCTQLSVARFHACALSTTGSVYCWGDNRAGQLGSDSNTQPALNWPAGSSGVDLGSMVAVRVVASTYSTCVVSQTGAVHCWGSGARDLVDRASTLYGSSTALPVKNAPALPLHHAWSSLTLRPDFNVKMDIVNANSACVAYGQGNVQCWGENRACMLGLPGTESDLTVHHSTGDMDLADAPFALGGLPSATPSLSPSATASHSATITGTPSSSVSPSSSATLSVSPSVSPSTSATVTASQSPSASMTSSCTPSPTHTSSVSPSPSTSSSGTPSWSVSPSVSTTMTVTSSSSPSGTPSFTASPSSSGTPSFTASPSSSGTPSATLSSSPTPSGTTTPTVSPSPTASSSPSPSGSGSSTPSPSPSEGGGLSNAGAAGLRGTSQESTDDGNHDFNGAAVAGTVLVVALLGGIAFGAVYVVRRLRPLSSKPAPVAA